MSGTHYVGVPRGSVTILAGSATAKIKVAIRAAGGAKSFDVAIFQPSQGTITVGQRRVMIPVS